MNNILLINHYNKITENDLIFRVRKRLDDLFVDFCFHDDFIYHSTKERLKMIAIKSCSDKVSEKIHDLMSNEKLDKTIFKFNILLLFVIDDLMQSLIALDDAIDNFDSISDNMFDSIFEKNFKQINFYRLLI